MDNINQADASHANSSLGFIDNDYHTEAPSASSQEWVTQGAASQEGVTHDSQAAPPLQTLDHWVDVSRGDFPASMRVSSVDAEVQTEPLSELTVGDQFDYEVHYSDVTMSIMSSQIIGDSSLSLAVCWD